MKNSKNMNKLSKDVAVLYMMTNVKLYEGMRGNIIEFNDEIKHRFVGDDLCVLLAKVFCCEQIIEKMVESLWIQNKIWRRIKNKNIEEELYIPNTHYLRVKNIYKLIDFEKKKKFYNCCNKFRIQRNKLAHSLLEYRIKEVFKLYSNMEKLYDDIFIIYQEQNFFLSNRVAEELQNPIKYLDIKKSYLKDIDIIKSEIMKIENKKILSNEDMEEISNLRQLYELLLDLNIEGYSERKLVNKMDMIF